MACASAADIDGHSVSLIDEGGGAVAEVTGMRLVDARRLPANLLGTVP